MTQTTVFAWFSCVICLHSLTPLGCVLVVPQKGGEALS